MARIVEQDYSEEDRGELTGRTQRAIREGEVALFNLDYDRMLDQEFTRRAKRILEDQREYVFEMTRHVMDRANQRYGGSTADGDEIGIRLIRPTDLETDPAAGVATSQADSFNFTFVAAGDQDVFGTAANPVNMGDNAQAESILIAGWSTNHPSPKTEAIQSSKFNSDGFVQPLPWDMIVDEEGGIKTVQASPVLVAFPGEGIEIDAVVFATGADVLRAIGVYVSTGTQLRTAEPAE